MASTAVNSRFRARNRWLVWSVAIVAAVVLLAAFMSLRSDVVPVSAAVAVRSTIRSVISTNGKVEPVQNFEAHAPIATTVRKLLVKEGDHVKKGQLLVQLNDAEARDQVARALAQVKAAQADSSAIEKGGTREEVLTLESLLVKARANRDTAQRNLEALQRLQQQGAAAPGEVKAAQDQLQHADADLKLLNQKQKDRYSKPEVARVDAQQAQAQAAYAAAGDTLNQLQIRAPFDGVVYSLPVRKGAYVNPGDLVLQEADLSKVLVRAFVDEPDVGRLAPGQEIEVIWDALPGRVWNGTVNTIPAVVKLRGTRNVGETTCVVDNHDFKLLPNVNVGVTIITAEHKGVLTVPREAIRQSDSKAYVFQIVDDQLQHRDVQTSISNLTQVEVVSGLSENAQVALTSINSKPLRNGLAVKVVR
ncbi:MAG: efflux RND transporter periplasmic adaptor subunit [Acidobacteriia bacterium]|nr:efflux RND transporter periplasmic adaptor subunit [Terriglobia bacterium]